MARILIVGAGLAGLSAALMLHEAGHRPTIVTRGIGGLSLSTGALSILGSHQGKIVRDYAQQWDTFIMDNSQHPYAVIGRDAAEAGVRWCAKAADFAQQESAGCNVLLPTAVGAVRASTYLPESMAASVLRDGKKYLVAGLSSVKDFPAQLIADNLNRSCEVKVQARAVTLNLRARVRETDSTAVNHARALDAGAAAVKLSAEANAHCLSERGIASNEYEELRDALRREVREGETILLPAVLGLQSSTYVDLAQEVGAPIGEIPLPPPSVPGIRLHDVLVNRCRDARIDIHLNAAVCGFEAEGNRVTGVKVQRAGRVTIERPDAVIYAPGGFESGALVRDSYGNISESVFDLPVAAPNALDSDDRADTLLAAGVSVNSAMNPLNQSGDVLYTNLFCVGSILGGARPWKEKSGEGIALGSAWAAVQAVSAHTRQEK